MILSTSIIQLLKYDVRCGECVRRAQILLTCEISVVFIRIVGVRG